MALLPTWIKPNVTTGFAIEVKRLFNALVSRLEQIGTGFSSIDAHVALNNDGSSIFTGSLGGPVRFVVGTTTITATDYIVCVDVSTMACTIYYPAAVDVPNRMFCVKKIDGTANNVFLATTIDGTTNTNIFTPKQRLWVIAAGTAGSYTYYNVT